MSYPPCRKMTEEDQTIHSMCNSILTKEEKQNDATKGEKKNWKRKKLRCRELVCSSSHCPLHSAEAASLSAGVKYRMLLLYNSKSWRSFFPSCLCLWGWLQALSLFYGHMHAEGISAGTFKETGAFSWQSGLTSLVMTASDQQENVGFES